MYSPGRRLLCSLVILFSCLIASAQPGNDNCTNASIITISNSGYGTGVFTSATFDLSTATVQTGENFAPAILVAGQNQKSIWYKFSIPTTRAVRVTLAQPGSGITAGDAGFAVYKTNTCLPVTADISPKLTPIGVFGNTYHPCVESGDYLVQVSGKAAANGPVYITVELAQTTATYDNQVDAYNFGTLAAPDFVKSIDYHVECQSTESAAETCTAISNSQQYNKTTWQTFTTPAYFDYVGLAVSGQNTYFVNPSVFEKIGFNLYAGDARTQALSALTLVDGCDSLTTNGYVAGFKTFRCTELQPNTTYSVQLFFRQSFINDIRFALTYEGYAPTQAPQPILASMPASNRLGVLPSNPSGVITNVTDQLGCNSRHSLHPCLTSLPVPGINDNGLSYGLSTFFTFTLSGSSRVNIGMSDFVPPYHIYAPALLMQLYRGDVTNTCSSLDASNLVTAPFLSNTGFALDCLPAGTYTLQVSGRDTVLPDGYVVAPYLYNNSYILSLRTDLGRKFNVSFNVTSRNPSNHFNLALSGAYDSINAVAHIMQPMQNGVRYTATADTFGCANTVLPFDTTCATGNTKVMYHQMIVPDSGIMSIRTSYWFKLYRGNADALAVAQNAHGYPSRINGLVPNTPCLYSYECDGTKSCVVADTYTLTNFGNDAMLGYAIQSDVRFDIVNTTHNSPANAENMGDIRALVPPTGGTITSAIDYFSCKDNAVVINGYTPCTQAGFVATKAIYRQFYLSSPSIVSISGIHSEGCNGALDWGTNTLFSGKATDGLAALTVMPAPWQCFNVVNTSASTCPRPLPVGWYTIVSYGVGPSYQNPLRDLNWYSAGSSIGHTSQVSVTISVPACPGQQFNRPYKAAVDPVTHQPFSIQWGNRVGSTTAYPHTDTTYALPVENFNCSVDTPFSAHPIRECSPTSTKVSYYVFRTTQESYVKIDTKNYWAAVYPGDVRTDSASFLVNTPIQPCLQSYGYIQLCKLQPGTYTLVIFASDVQSCDNVQPTIYIDKIGYSRFDFANSAYDFGVVPPDSLYHTGKVGDVNPLDPGRAASNDFFYCTTGSSTIDPTEGSCGTIYNPKIYQPGTTYEWDPSTYSFSVTSKRNLWYTFVVKEGGNIKVKVTNKTADKQYQYRFAVYKSNVDGTLPFATVVSTGQVDSTHADGLTFIAANPVYNYCSGGGNEASFYRSPCTAVPERYYILVENTNAYPYDYSGMQPNSQAEVSILIDSINVVQPLFDHYSQASTIGGGSIGNGSYTGATDNFSCATADPADPLGYCSPKSLWYKFTSNVTGHVKFRLVTSDGQSLYSWTDIALYRQMIPNDSTLTGMQFLNGSNASTYDPATGNYWATQCISPGTYYLFLSGCSMVGQSEHPEVQIVEEAGDFCSKPVVANLNGAGTSITSVLVDCHTIGTDYGEFNPTLTCPPGLATNLYKTSWFRIDITGTDTLDLTTYLTENTNANSSDIKYRLMNGDCNAMQERSCVQDALTHDTYKCLPQGSYFVQVFTPVTAASGLPVTGMINLNLLAVHHADTCAPLVNCLSNAYFQKQFDCTTSQAVQFINYSTYGSTVTNNWDFGYNGQTSTAVSPQFVYPALTTSQKYYITLTVRNNSCGGQSVYRDSITIPARPVVNLGPNVSLCNGGTLLLDATSHPGATYSWQNGSVAPQFTVTAPGKRDYYVAVTYNGCIARDTINVNINPIVPTVQYKYLCSAGAITLDATRALGESHHWNTGATTPSISTFNNGVYWDDMSLNGCTIRDSFIVARAVSPLGNDRQACFASRPVVLNATTQGATGYTWQNGTTASTFNATAAGLYWVDVAFGSCTLRDTIILTDLQPALNSLSAATCQNRPYVLPSGHTITTTGIYNDTLRSVAGCDSLINTINLTVQNLATVTINTSICPGQNYILPWGTVVNATGTYKDTLHYISGCDSVIRTVNLAVQTVTAINTTPTICSGQTYTLPWGPVVNTPGIYTDTLHSIAGCDSIIRKVDLTILTLTTENHNPVICDGASYTLPWGPVVNTTGVYGDTLHSVFGCDSVRRVVHLIVQTPVSQIINASICNGASYTLPWGTVVNTAAVYRDTLHYTTGCDSVRRTVNLTVQTVSTQVTNPVICDGASYTLPWGTIVNATGIYQDTLHYTTGCDSIRRTVNLVVQIAATQTTNPVICEGASYTLPWGTVVNVTGIYRDTLHYNTTGCDSIRRIVNLTVQTATEQIINAVICEGASYTLPWGTVVNATGIYRDTLRYTTGCDSIRRIINLTVQTVTSQITNPVICDGSSYTLPWGTVVNTQGVYLDTLHAAGGCDSIRRTVNLTVQTATTQTFNPVICEGGSYTLPWGTVVNAPGVYRDILHYTSGCDSIRRIVNLAVQTATVQTSNPVICGGASYTLPWGMVVNATGIYRDTLRYTTGCDSIRRVVALTVQAATLQVINPVICEGSSYTLPWGIVVNTAGTYPDTLHYVSGCDSIRRTVNVTVKSVATQTTSATICQGASYTLPWGTIVNATGMYQDTLHYTQGCDSVRRTVNVFVQTVALVTLNPVICQGAGYTLPTGVVVTVAGTYRDTLHYNITGCDSIRRTVNLQVKAAAISSNNAAICSGETYTLPWGPIVNRAGIYKDTIRTVSGCDSLIRTINLAVNPKPVVSLSKSNDVDCILGISKLQASGGGHYEWTPAQSLSNATIYNPVASPTATTWYYVLVTNDKGCSAKDSIEVKVIAGVGENGYLVPNAFTPNNDGRNDCFGVEEWGAVTDFEFTIYDRWGIRVFFTNNPKQCWDGRYKGVELGSTVFVYQIRAKGLCGAIFRKGTVVLIR